MEPTERIDSLEKYKAYLNRLGYTPSHQVIASQMRRVFGSEGELIVDLEAEFWQLREWFRTYVEKTYTRIPSSCALDCYTSEAHFVHLSEHDPRLIAYTPNPEKGRRDIQVRTTPGKYLKKHYPTLTDEQIRTIVDDFRWHFSTETVLFARTETEICNVYADGPDSCMSKSMSEYDSHIRPVAVYAVPWLAVAYLERDGDIKARCLVYDNPDDPADKRRSRIYGDAALLEPKLDTLGYHPKSFDGVLIKKIVCKNTNGYVMPYIDDYPHYKYQSVDFYDEDHFVISQHGDLLATETNGLAKGRDEVDDDEADGRCDCSHCGNSVWHDETHYSEYHDRTLCDRCVDRHYSSVIVHRQGDEDLIEDDAKGFAFIETNVDGECILNDANLLHQLGYERLDEDIYGENEWAPGSECVCTEDQKTILGSHAETDFVGNVWHRDGINLCVNTSHVYDADDFEELHVSAGGFSNCRGELLIEKLVDLTQTMPLEAAFFSALYGHSRGSIEEFFDRHKDILEAMIFERKQSTLELDNEPARETA